MHVDTIIETYSVAICQCSSRTSPHSLSKRDTRNRTKLQIKC